MLDIVSSANVACGFHAGDPSTCSSTAALAKHKGVALGASGLQRSGRDSDVASSAGTVAAEIERMIAYQIGAMQGVAALAGIASRM